MMEKAAAEFGRLMELARGFQTAKTFLVACDLDVFSHLTAPATAGDLAARLQVNTRALEMLLNGLTALGLINKEGDAYRNSPLAGAYLVAGEDNYRGAIFKHLHHTWEGWSDLAHVVAHGTPRQGDPSRWVQSHQESQDDEVRDFIWGMHAIARDTAPLVLPRLDLSRARHVLDLGGGPATYAIAFVQRYPDLRATVFDLPGPIRIAQENIALHGVADRVETRAGNFLSDDIGAGYDFIWVSQILHSHSDSQCQFLLNTCAAALVPGGQLAVHEFFLQDDGYTPPSAAFFGLHMLAVTAGGRAYKSSEVATWMQQAGIAKLALHPVHEHSAILVGSKI